METIQVITALCLAIGILILLTVKCKVHPFFSLVAASFTFGIFSGMGIPNMLAAFSEGVGSTVASIGIVIALGTVTGTLLEKSGAAETMAQTILKITGEKHAALGLAITGYFVSIPVFCDSAFVLLAPIAKRLSRNTKISMTTMAVSLAMGLHATHMLVPPTPGPLAVAGILGADLGMVIVMGAVVSLPVTVVGYLVAQKLGKKYYYLPDDLEEVSEPEEKKHVLPSPLMAFLPIMTPIILMLSKTIVSMMGIDNIFSSILNIAGEPIVALLAGVLLSLVTYLQIFPKDYSVWEFEGAVGDALKTAGQIVLIVGAGGAFGAVLKASPLQDILTNAFAGLSIGILAPFLIGFLFRTCVGSATVAMVTAATMIAPLLDILGMNTPMGLVIAMLACAAGGFMVFHGNDDFFWVVTSTSKMETSTAYKVLPIASIAQAFTALAVVFLLKVIFL